MSFEDYRSKLWAVSFEKTVEKAIRAAMQEGKFDNLPNAGRPIDLDDYFKAPEDLRAAYSILKNANLVPEEVELLNEVERLEGELAAARDPEWRESLRGQIEERRVRVAMLLEERRRR